MEAFEFWQVLTQNLLHTSLPELIAVIFGLLSVYYSMKVNILVYPTGIISVLIYVVITWQVGLYADMFINLVYFVMSIYGWYKWLRPSAGSVRLPVSFSSHAVHLTAIITTVISFALMQYILRHFTDSTVPYIDAFTTSVFITGMWLMALKKVENWYYWIIGDVVSVPLYFHKELIFTSFQFFIFLVLAVLGLIRWRKEAVHA
ncbi:MAG TPA: nicotinamide riboside transporter PnuC [Bacteroidales bacterium]|nr:nicotinamide riboside transporter PnuC [Bacteroidales bacterium]